MKVMVLANNDVGLYQFRKELIEELLKQHEVIISLPNGDFIKPLEDIGCKFIDTPVDRRGINPVTDLKLLRLYRKLLKQEKPDLVITYTIKPNVYGGFACRLARIPYIVNITGLGTAVENEGILQKITVFLYKLGIKKAKKVFFQNTANRDFMIKHKVVVDSYDLLPGSGVNLDENCYEPYPSEENGIRFLFVGRIMKDKGIEEFLSCAKKIKEVHPECSFDIVGGYDEDLYRQRVEEFEQSGIVEYFGEQKDVHSFMKTHHALILPSYHEGLSNVLLEAAACGRPVLASDIPGCRETYDEGITGFGFEPKDSQSLINAVEKLLTKTSKEREEMGWRGRKKVENEFNRKLVIDKYIEQINEIKR